MSSCDRSELADFLRSRREKLSPAALGLSETRRRRTPGLRREEVAERAGIGVDWYIRLEQGRAVRPSVATIAALARALDLSETEHDHLRALGRAVARDRFEIETVPDAVRRIVDGMALPAYVTGRRWDVLAWNDAAAALLTDFSRIAEGDRNILLFMFTDPVARCRFGEGWEDEARRMVAQFRTTYDLWSGDPAFARLLDRLQLESRAFGRYWEAHDVRNVALGRKTLHHPDRGASLFDYATFQANDDPRLRLAVYTPVAAALRF